MGDALGESAVISVKRWLPGVTKKDDELDPTDAYHKSMFGGDYKPKHKKTAEYCRQSAFKQAHSMISVFERRNTLEDLARKSKDTIQSIYHNRTMSDMDRSKAMKELGNLQSLSNLLVAAEQQENNNDDEMSVTASQVQKKETKAQKLHRQLSQHISYGSGGFEDAGAGGAGALPVSTDIINIVDSHFNDEEDTIDQHKGKDESHMSYIYGQEESQQHHLPEYSVDHRNQQPHLPGLDENNENDDVVAMGMGTSTGGQAEEDDIHGQIVSAFKQ